MTGDSEHCCGVFFFFLLFFFCIMEVLYAYNDVTGFDDETIDTCVNFWTLVHA